jgi:hypothetical protein
MEKCTASCLNAEIIKSGKVSCEFWPTAVPIIGHCPYPVPIYLCIGTDISEIFCEGYRFAKPVKTSTATENVMNLVHFPGFWQA